MEKNNDYTFGSFEDYLEDIKNLIRNYREINDVWIRRSIQNSQITPEEVDVNYEYFREEYDSNKTPMSVLLNIHHNTDDLYRKIDNIPDEDIIEESLSRNIGTCCLRNVNTEELEEEILDRWDCSLIKKETAQNDLEEEIEYILSKNSKTLKDAICRVLGFNNSFAYSKEDIINEINKRL